MRETNISEPTENNNIQQRATLCNLSSRATLERAPAGGTQGLFPSIALVIPPGVFTVLLFLKLIAPAVPSRCHWSMLPIEVPSCHPVLLCLQPMMPTVLLSFQQIAGRFHFPGGAIHLFQNLWQSASQLIKIQLYL